MHSALCRQTCEMMAWLEVAAGLAQMSEACCVPWGAAI